MIEVWLFRQIGFFFSFGRRRRRCRCRGGGRLFIFSWSSFGVKEEREEKESLPFFVFALFAAAFEHHQERKMT